jgi:hypothetical protein
MSSYILLHIWKLGKKKHEQRHARTGLMPYAAGIVPDQPAQAGQELC